MKKSVYTEALRNDQASLFQDTLDALTKKFLDLDDKAPDAAAGQGATAKQTITPEEQVKRLLVPLYPSPRKIDQVRRELLTRLRNYDQKELSVFASRMFTSEELVLSYMRSEPNLNQRGFAFETDAAALANVCRAMQTCRYPKDYIHHERELATFAVLIEYSGFYVYRRRRALGVYSPNPTTESLFKSIRESRNSFLGDAMRQLNVNNRQLCGVLMGVLGLREPHLEHADKVARIQAAMGDCVLRCVESFSDGPDWM